MERKDGEVRGTRWAMLRAVKIAAQSLEDADALLDQTVEVARAHGATWDDIGQAVGINAEAARKRYRKTG